MLRKRQVTARAPRTWFSMPFHQCSKISPVNTDINPLNPDLPKPIIPHSKFSVNTTRVIHQPTTNLLPLPLFLFSLPQAGVVNFEMTHQAWMTPGIQPKMDKQMLMRKLESQPVLKKTARGGRKIARK